jgi:hypothetical protein
MVRPPSGRVKGQTVTSYQKFIRALAVALMLVGAYAIVASAWAHRADHRNFHAMLIWVYQKQQQEQRASEQRQKAAQKAAEKPAEASTPAPVEQPK